MKKTKLCGTPHRKVGSWQLAEVWNGHCHNGKCYIFTNGAYIGGYPYLYHIPAQHFWGIS